MSTTRHGGARVAIIKDEVLYWIAGAPDYDQNSWGMATQWSGANPRQQGVFSGQCQATAEPEDFGQALQHEQFTIQRGMESSAMALGLYLTIGNGWLHPFSGQLIIDVATGPNLWSRFTAEQATVEITGRSMNGVRVTITYAVQFGMLVGGVAVGDDGLEIPNLRFTDEGIARVTEEDVPRETEDVG